MMMGPPAPVASKSMDDSSTIHYNSTFEEVVGGEEEEEEEEVVMDTPTLTVKGTSVVENQNNNGGGGGGNNNGGMKYQGEPGSSSQAIGSHLRLIATSSMSYDDYERLRDESRMLKLEHAQKYGGGGANGGGRQVRNNNNEKKNVVGEMMIKEGKKSEGPVHLVASKSGEESSSILLDQAMNNRASNRASSITPSQGKEFSTSTTLITNKHRSSLNFLNTTNRTVTLDSYLTTEDITYCL